MAITDWIWGIYCTATAGSLMAVLVSLICGFVAFLIWFPFIKIYDKKLVEQEKGNDALI